MFANSSLTALCKRSEGDKRGTELRSLRPGQQRQLPAPFPGCLCVYRCAVTKEKACSQWEMTLRIDQA